MDVFRFDPAHAGAGEIRAQTLLYGRNFFFQFGRKFDGDKCADRFGSCGIHICDLFVNDGIIQLKFIFQNVAGFCGFIFTAERANPYEDQFFIVHCLFGKFDRRIAGIL